MKKIGTVELAKEFGVNIATISRALNDKPGVGADLRRRIVTRARELNYQPKGVFQINSDHRTHLVGVMGPGKQLDAFGRQISSFDNPFWGRIFCGIEQEARSIGYDLLFGSSGAFTNDGETVPPHFLSQKRVDGILIVDTLPEVSATRETVAQSLAYLAKRYEQIQYPTFATLGYPIGSGIVESANKLVVEARLANGGGEIPIAAPRAALGPAGPEARD